MSVESLLTALGAAIPASAVLILAIVRARKFAQDGGLAAQAELVSTLQGLVTALTAENAKLRTDLAGCESDFRRFRQVLPHD